jgi:predicted GIY-YIG superfamily endonuclease
MIDFTSVPHHISFDDIIGTFKNKLLEFDPVANKFDVNLYFGDGIGPQCAAELLYNDGEIKEKKDFKGLYVFLDDDVPFYVGISKCVIKRIIQHTKGHKHQTSSLAYSIGKEFQQKTTGDYSKITRKEFNFPKYAGMAKEFLRKKQVAFIPIDDDIELYLFEIYCAMELRTLMMNNFSTH